MGYAIYLRKSRADAEAEAHGEGETLAKHLKILNDLAKNKRIKIDKVYKEIVSGDSIASRPQMQLLLHDIEKGKYDAVLVMEVERLARGDTIDQGIVAQTFKYSNTKIITPIKEYDPTNEFDEEYFEFGLFMSRREYKTIKRRLQTGRITSVKEGKYCGSVAPYGYDREKLKTDKGYTLKINDKEAKAVEIIFDLYSKGIGCINIAKRLDELNIKPRKNDSWSQATISGILRNPVYIGKIIWDRRKTENKIVNGKIVKSRPRAKEYLLIDGLHAPIIDENLFYSVQKRLKTYSSPKVNTNNILKNSLSGLIYCKCCGNAMRRKPYSKNRARDVLICVNRNCNNKSAVFEVVEDRVLNWLKEYYVNLEIEIKNNKSKDTTIQQNTVDSISKEISGLKTQLNKAYEFLEKEIYTVDVFVQRKDDLNSQINELEHKKNTLENEIKSIDKYNKLKRDMLPKVKHIIDIYKKLDDASEKNRLLKEIIEKIEYKREQTKKRTTKVLDDFELIFYPKVNY